MRLKLHSSDTFFWSSNRKCVLIGKNIFFARTDCEYIERFKKTKIIEGEEFSESFPSVINKTKCSLHASGFGYVQPVLFRGKFYNLHALGKINTLEEISGAANYLYEIDRSFDVAEYWNSWDSKCDTDAGQNFSKVRFIDGHSRYVYRDITLRELQMGYSGLIKAQKDFEEDCEKPMKMFVRDVCNILQLSEKRYKSGKYNLNDQMIKRLHSKIQYKSKNKHLWYQ